MTIVNVNMREIAISKFKATCLAVLEEVRRTRVPVRVTRFGRPVADIVPPSPVVKSGWVGRLSHLGEVDDDIVGPIGAFEGWKVREP